MHPQAIFLLRDALEGRRLADAGWPSQNEHGIWFVGSDCTLQLARALTQLGQPAEGWPPYEEGLRLYLARGSEGGLPYLLPGMAERMESLDRPARD